MTVRIVGPKDPTAPDELVIDTTSRSRTWSRGMSPFFLGPIPLYPGSDPPAATCMENAWQFAKVYPWMVRDDGNPSDTYFKWAKNGWSNPRAIRYPAGKGTCPSFTWWAGEKLGYIKARKRVYIPLYAKAVMGTPAFAQLRVLYHRVGAITLWDFDGYDYGALGMTLQDVVHDPTRKMGHAFVIAHLLDALNAR